MCLQGVWKVKKERDRLKDLVTEQLALAIVATIVHRTTGRCRQETVKEPARSVLAAAKDKNDQEAFGLHIPWVFTVICEFEAVWYSARPGEESDTSWWICHS